MKLGRGQTRGAAAIGAVLALVVLQLAVVVTVVAGARDQSMTASRIAAARAFYAGEAGMQMSLREALVLIDEDGDGAVGRISGDGVPANDPVLDNASFSVMTAGMPPVLTSSSRCAGALRTERLQWVGRWGGLPKRVVYSDWPGAIPQYRVWNGSSWGSASGTVNVGAGQYWMVAADCPVRPELIMVCSNQAMDVRATVGTAAGWSNMVTLTGALQNAATRPFWVGYEQVSGRALLIYSIAGAPNLWYQVWDGNSWSGRTVVTTPLQDEPRFIKLVPRGGSNQLVMYGSDNSGRLCAMVWTGSSFTDKVLLQSSGTHTSYESVDAAWESVTGRCMVVWGTTTADRPRMAVWNGAWGSPSDLGLVDGKVRFVQLSSQPSSNRVMMGLLDDSGRIRASLWSGTTWGGYTQLDANAALTTSRCFDLCYEPAGARVFAMYSRSGAQRPVYRVHDGTSWGGPQNGPNFPGPAQIVQLTAGPKNRQVFALLALDNGSLQALYWDGTTLGARQQMTANTNGGNPGEVYMVSKSAVNTGATGFNGWTAVAPQ
jgi:hypothetical protein